MGIASQSSKVSSSNISFMTNFIKACVYREDTADPDAENGHAVLITVLLCRAHIRKLQAAAGQLMQSPDVCGRDKRIFVNVEAERAGGPFCIMLVRFLAFDGFHIFRMCENDMHVRFRDIKNGYPVFTCGFHTDAAAVLCKNPVAKVIHFVKTVF